MLNSSKQRTSRFSRRTFLAAAAAALPVALTAGNVDAQRGGNIAPLPDPKYTLAVHIIANFPKDISPKDALLIAAQHGAKAYQFGGLNKIDIPLEELRATADEHGMRCASIAGTGSIGMKTGLTVTGHEKAYLDFFAKTVKSANILGAQNLVSFVGSRSETIPWATQYEQIISGLRKAGDIAGEAGVYLTLEPLNVINHADMSVLTAQEGFKILREVDHPHVKLDFDIYHLQQSEGNLTNNLREGMKENLIQFVEVGDVPGRLQPGTGEINFQHIFDELRRLGYDGFVGMEHFVRGDFQTAFAQVKELAGAE